ncbi:putative acyl-CoA synthetase family member 2, mitochondrial-like [Apostichopus japonicus]|uniref:Medium-chain acyl-CoA ligase ACSF2, mitochondrial n=1 Tax=Stichopus japonicus TaxID=307972 RepID=A0A2G8KHA4_STIJA|nr:putative acyl-CoA synthetase family member 2, mitochondrial-like [Apostichopus japonicus]
MHGVCLKRVDNIKFLGLYIDSQLSSSLWRPRNDVRLSDSYFHGTSDRPLLGKTIGEALQNSAEKHPNKNAFVYGTEGDRHTYSQLLDEVDRLAAGFLSIGITKGDRVGMWGPNIKEWILTQYTCARIGAILVNVNPAYRLQELEYAINKVGMKAIVAPQTFKTQDYYGMLVELCPELNTAKPAKLQSKRLPDLRSVIMATQENLNGTLKFDDVRQMGGEKRHDIEKLGRELQFDDPINLQFTSGTTGHPKGCVLTHHNIVNNAYMCGHGLDYCKENAVLCSTLPLYHCGGCVVGSLAAMVHGATCVLPAPSHETEKILQSIQNEKCTVIMGTPTIYIDTFNHPKLRDYDTSSMSIGGIGATPCPPELLKLFETKMNMSVVVMYGMTESSPVSNMTRIGDSAEIILNTVGRPVDHVEVKVVDPQTKKIVPVNERGEVCMRGYSVMRGYWKNPEQTAETIDEEGWLHSGDIGVMNENGYFNIVGRIKDMIIRGGTNIFPTEIENLIHQHPKVENVQIVAVPDERMGEELCACVKLKHGETSSADEIKAFCQKQIAHYKIPRYVEFVDSFPMTATLKVQKYELTRIMTEKLGL